MQATLCFGSSAGDVGCGSSSMRCRSGVASYPPFIDVQPTPSAFGHLRCESSKSRRKLAVNTTKLIRVDSCACPTSHSLAAGRMAPFLPVSS